MITCVTNRRHGCPGFPCGRFPCWTSSLWIVGEYTKRCTWKFLFILRLSRPNSKGIQTRKKRRTSYHSASLHTKWSLLSSADTNRERCKRDLTSFLLLATVRNEPTKLRPALPHWASLTLSHSQVDQCQSSPAASPEILHHTVGRTWLFIAYSDERWLHLPITPHTLCISLQKVGRMYFLNLGVKGSVDLVYGPQWHHRFQNVKFWTSARMQSDL